MTKYGIDVSKYQGNIDWTKVKASGKAEFVILRAGIGNEKDIRFEEYYNGCQANGIPVGAYWYSKAVSEAQARQEAQKFLQVISGKQFAYPLYFDIEMNQQFALGKAKCSAIAAAFLNVLESAGYFAGIYASKSHLESYLSAEVRSRYAVWVAHYGVKKTTYSGQFGMWQYSDSGTVSGIPDNQVDFDECYVDYPEIIRKAGLNGFPKSVETVEIQKETIEMTDVEFMQLCRETVRDYVNTHADKTDNVFIGSDDVYVVWSCKTLQNWKALVSTALPDGMYYEITHNGDKNETYVDCYKKWENFAVRKD